MSGVEIECPKYEALAGGRRCKHYLDNGGCARPDELMCVEWLKRNGHPVPRTPVATQRQETSEAARTQVVAVRELSHEALESFRLLGLEVCLTTGDGRAVWIVPEYTGGDRLEVRVDHAATLAALCAALPGARVSDVRRCGAEGRR